MMETAYKPIEPGFYEYLEAAVMSKKYVKLQYFTEIRELITTMSVLKSIATRNEEKFLVLGTGEEIRLDRIVRIDTAVAPAYAYIDDYSCDC